MKKFHFILKILITLVAILLFACSYFRTISVSAAAQIVIAISVLYIAFTTTGTKMMMENVYPASIGMPARSSGISYVI
ncbi:hypothetical protein [Sporolactobacillus sp. KGMB 08714]|uniref:hypothetical protein n=1 Tax=Sporolactobacillus sp. KGMB 08714 TaxID=3064704 RepID=UPI002FBD6C0E